MASAASAVLPAAIVLSRSFQSTDLASAAASNSAAAAASSSSVTRLPLGLRRRVLASQISVHSAACSFDARSAASYAGSSFCERTCQLHAQGSS